MFNPEFSQPYMHWCILLTEYSHSCCEKLLKIVNILIFKTFYLLCAKYFDPLSQIELSYWLTDLLLKLLLKLILFDETKDNTLRRRWQNLDYWRKACLFLELSRSVDDIIIWGVWKLFDIFAKMRFSISGAVSMTLDSWSGILKVMLTMMTLRW